MSIFENYKSRYIEHKPTEFSIQEYLDKCREEPFTYANVAQKMVKAIGEPTYIDTSKEGEEMARIFSGRTIRRYDSFSMFYGIEDTIDKIVSFYRQAAQGMEEANQILYLLGPVGSAKSSIAERLKQLCETQPFYTIMARNKSLGNAWQISPLYENPLGLFNTPESKKDLLDDYNIPNRAIRTVMSPWLVKRLIESNGDITKFKIVKMWPSILEQVNITKVEPGDDNNYDISTLVGKTDISKVEDFPQSDPDAYAWKGGLNITTQGMMEFVEMFKAPFKMLHPLLTCTQEHNYNGTESMGAFPHEGHILAHSNVSEWEEFKNNKKNEAMVNRCEIVKVKYNLRYNEEIKIYQKILNNSELADRPCAPGVLEMLGQFSCLTRLEEPENSSFFSKLEVYNGKTMKEHDKHAKTLVEYRDMASLNEGMEGFPTRDGFKVLSRVFNFDPHEISANPVQMLSVLEDRVKEEQYPSNVEEVYLNFIRGILAPKYAQYLEDEIQRAYLESYGEYGQNIFDRYIQFADFWSQDEEWKDPDTGVMMNRDYLDKELKMIEEPAQVKNPEEFREEVVKFVLRARAKSGGRNPKWTSYEKMRTVIEKKMFSNTDELLPIISFTKKANEEDQKKHDKFVKRMMKGKDGYEYTERTVKLLVEWHIRYKQNH